MKNKLPRSTFRPLLVLLLAVISVACDDGDDTQTMPNVTTAAVTAVTSSSAVSGGNIISNGNAPITASGVVYSITNVLPTTSDSKTNENAAEGVFSSILSGLESGKSYHVRAYATNNVGTSYGEAVSFTTGNNAPEVTGVEITGDISINAVLTASYHYNDAEGNVESGTVFKWYLATDATGAGESLIEEATASIYTILPTDEFKFIRVGITPKSNIGTTTGVEVKSDFVGPVPEAPETVTFTYAGNTVTYGVINSPVTQRKWMDRNLGAPHAPSSYNDWANFGDMFQWGRGADGHQLLIRAATAQESSLSSTTDVISSEDDPNTSSFILAPPPKYDWRSLSNDKLWQADGWINNPCPEGWHVPTKQEWSVEFSKIDLGKAYEQLKITATGYRSYDVGGLGVVSNGYYWASTPFENNTTAYKAWFIEDTDDPADPTQFGGEHRASGLSCRCIKNTDK